MRLQIALLLFLTQPGDTYYCPPTQRYDLATFPPRCIDCAHIISNEMSLAQIPTQLRISRSVQKFSPGMPQNQTCGCWRANVNQSVITVGLNASWVVSGLLFSSSRGRWLKEINIRASGDNTTFMDWGNYSFQNFSDAALVIFDYPVRAQFFRILVMRYANHYVGLSTGFPLKVQALVSNTQPFACDCPRLSNGFCCPYLNMTVRNDKCVWCMDPTKISTIVVDGCGKCRQGTFEYQGKCYSQSQASVANDFQVTNPQSNGVYWSVDLSFSADSRTLISLYLSNQSNASRLCVTGSCDMRSFVHIYSQWSFSNGVVPLDSHLISSQYLQFDRGRYTLNMTKAVIRSWASCPDSKACNGVIVALFVTTFRNSTAYKTQQLERQLKFEMDIQSLVLSGGGTQTLMLAHMELHYFVQMDAWVICLIGAEWDTVYVQWDQGKQLAANRIDNLIAVNPPKEWKAMRVSNELNSSTLLLQQPVSVITHGAFDAIQYSGIMVRIQYGLGFASTPSPGDSDQLVFVTARSPQPIRLKSLSTSIQNGPPFAYTTSKGFIMDPTRVLDLSLGCLKPTLSLVNWLSNAIMVLPDSPPEQMTTFITRSCALIRSGAVSKGYWLAPVIPFTGRSDAADFQVVAEFV